MPKPNVPKMKETKTGYTWLGDDGIVRAVHKPGAEESAEDARENMEATIAVAGPEPRPILVDLSQVGHIHKEAREVYTKSPQAKVNGAVAILLRNNLAGRAAKIFANLFTTDDKPNCPIEIFTDEDQAMAWLSQYVR